MQTWNCQVRHVWERSVAWYAVGSKVPKHWRTRLQIETREQMTFTDIVLCRRRGTSSNESLEVLMSRELGSFETRSYLFDVVCKVYCCVADFYTMSNLNLRIARRAQHSAEVVKVGRANSRVPVLVLPICERKLEYHDAISIAQLRPSHHRLTESKDPTSASCVMFGTPYRDLMV